MNMKTFFSPEKTKFSRFYTWKKHSSPQKTFPKCFFFFWKNVLPLKCKKKVIAPEKKKNKKKKYITQFHRWKCNLLEKKSHGTLHACCLLANVSWRLVYVKVICMLGSDKHCLSNVSNGVITVPPIKLALWWTQLQKFNTALMWLRL